MQIRKASTADIPRIRELAELIWRPTYTPLLGNVQVQYMLDTMYSTEALTRQMEEGQAFVLAIVEGKEIGFASYSKITPAVYKLNKIYVDTALQGRGYGRGIMEAVMSELKELGAERLQLNVNRYNKARDFYEHLGFEVLYEEDIDIGSGFFMNDYVMEKDL